MKAPSAEALEFAAQWVEEGYEETDPSTSLPCETEESRKAVAAFLRAEAERRREANFVRLAVKQTGCAPRKAREVYRNKLGPDAVQESEVKG